MSRDPENYRPQSPDLSAFAPPPRSQRLPSYHPDPVISSAYPAHQHRNSYDASPYFSPATATPSTSYFGAQPHAEATSFAPQYPVPLPSPSFTQANSSTQRYSASRVAPPSNSPFNQPVHRQFQPDTPPNISMPRPRRRNSSADDSEDVSYTPNSTGPARSAKKRKSEPDHLISTFASPSYRGIDVKTKFPVARIKRIMQADDDVGKVAQATPTAVSKALELFMIQLVLKGTTEARTKNSKKVSAVHLKAALMKDSQFDFLGDICEKVQSTEKKGSRTKSDDDNSDEANGTAPKGKARAKRKGPGNKMEEDSD